MNAKKKLKDAFQFPSDFVDRLEYWATEREIPIGLVGGETELSREYYRLTAGKQDHSELSTSTILRCCKEIVFDIENEIPVFHYVMYALKTENLALTAAPILASALDKSDNIAEEVSEILALARIYDVPVLPNNARVSEALIDYYKHLIQHGFLAQDGGTKRRVKLTQKATPLASGSEIFPENFWSLHPAEISIVGNVASQKIAQLEFFSNLVAEWETSLSGFEKLLSSDRRSENEIQRFLTQHPIIFGNEYIRITPKQKLGAEFQTDYRLDSVYGTVDFVELEAPSLKLFTQRNNPSADLVHAEQQALDWLEWAESNYAYGRVSMPGLREPRVFIVIGRDSSLSVAQIDKLRRRNSLFRGRIYISTYDALLARSRDMLTRLRSPSQAFS